MPLGRRTPGFYGGSSDNSCTLSKASPFGLSFSPQIPHYRNKTRHILVLIYIKRPKILCLLQLHVTVCSVGHKTDLPGSQSQQVGVHETARSRTHIPSQNLPASGKRMQSFQDQVRWPSHGSVLDRGTRHRGGHCEEIPSVLALGTEGIRTSVSLHQRADARLPRVLGA